MAVLMAVLMAGLLALNTSPVPKHNCTSKTSFPSPKTRQQSSLPGRHQGPGRSSKALVRHAPGLALSPRDHGPRNLRKKRPRLVGALRCLACKSGSKKAVSAWVFISGPLPSFCSRLVLVHLTISSTTRNRNGHGARIRSSRWVEQMIDAFSL
jgi:hypothetical protein